MYQQTMNILNQTPYAIPCNNLFTFNADQKRYNYVYIKATMEKQDF